MDTDSVKDEIKRRVKIEDVVSQYVELQRAGSRLKARCPFHEEKTPSFFVNPGLGLYKCFGCGVGGDVFDFLMRIEGLTFPEAGERLAERCGLQWSVHPGEEARSKRRQLMRRANDLAAQHFQGLLSSEAGKTALDYLRGRDFSPETIEKFRLGYAADSWDGLLRHLRQKGIDEGLAAEAGLAKERASGGHYDVFRHRVMFPISDVGDRVIGFGGRALDPDDPAKYLNTPDTPMFRKGRHVYALNLARAAITSANSVVIVEGYTDVLALHQAGIDNVVACLGTALTQDHLDLLSRYAEEIILAYDADTAGMNAAARNIPMLEACAAEVRIVLLPPGLDPDECVKQDGPEGFLRLLEKRTTPVEYLIDLEFARHLEEGPEGITRAAKSAVEVLVGVRDRARLNDYVARVVDKWGAGNPQRAKAIERPLREELDRRFSQRQAPAASSPDSPRDRRFIVETVTHLAAEVPRGVLLSEREILAAALAGQDYAVMLADRLSPQGFFDEAHQAIAEAVVAELEAGGLYSTSAVIERLPEGERARDVAVELAFEEPAQIEREVIAGDIAKLTAYRASGRHDTSYEVPPDEETPAPQPIEDFEALKKVVVEKINAGAPPDDPDIMLYKSHAARSHGAGALGYVGTGGEFLAAVPPGKGPEPQAADGDTPTGGATPQRPDESPADEGS